MKSTSSLTHKRMYLDTNVWLVLLVTILLCLALVSYNLINSNSCVPFVISAQNLTHKDSVFRTNETLVFKTSYSDPKEILWKFGDNTNNERSVTTNMLHKFKSQGEFTVQAVINGRCSNEIKVNIIKSQEPDSVVEISRGEVPKISGNLSPLVGAEEHYVTNAVGHSYEWKILDKALFTTVTSQDASFTFPKSGLYTLQLTIDHDRRRRSLVEINVSEALSTTKKPKRTEVDIQNKVYADAIAKAIKNHNEKISEKNAQSEKPVEKLSVEKPAAERTPVENLPLEKPPVEKSIVPKVQPDVAPAAPKRKATFIHNQIFQSLLEGVVTGEKTAADFDQYLINGGATKVRVNNKEFKTFSEFCQEIKRKKITIKSVELKRDDFDKTIVKQINVEDKKAGLLGL